MGGDGKKKEMKSARVRKADKEAKKENEKYKKLSKNGIKG